MTRLTAVALAALLPALPLVASEGDHDHDHDHDDAHHLAVIGDVEILHAWTNAGTGAEARVYMEIANEGDSAVTLTGGHAEIAEAVALMGASIDAGSTDLVAVPEAEIKAGGEIDLTPDGLFLHLTGLSAPLIEGEEFEMMLDIAPLGEVEIHVAIEAEDARQHSHAGHSH